MRRALARIPISSFTYLLINKTPTDAAKGKKLLDFVKWALSDVSNRRPRWTIRAVCRPPSSPELDARLDSLSAGRHAVTGAAVSSERAGGPLERPTTPPDSDAGGRRTLRVRIQGASHRRSHLYRCESRSSHSVSPCCSVLVAVEIFIAGWPALHSLWLSRSCVECVGPGQRVFGAAPAIYGTLLHPPFALGHRDAARDRVADLSLGVLATVAAPARGVSRRPARRCSQCRVRLWGVFVLLPVLRVSVNAVSSRDTLHLGVLPLLLGPAYGPSMLAAGLILSIMALPYISSVSREVLLAVPRSQREAALALGATKWETIWGAVCHTRNRHHRWRHSGPRTCTGETMAVTMLIGNRPRISASLFAPGYTMASLIANEFSEASGDLHLSALMAVGFVLFVITLIVQTPLPRWLVWQVSRGAGEKTA